MMTTREDGKLQFRSTFARFTGAALVALSIAAACPWRASAGESPDRGATPYGTSPTSNVAAGIVAFAAGTVTCDYVVEGVSPVPAFDIAIKLRHAAGGADVNLTSISITSGPDLAPGIHVKTANIGPQLSGLLADQDRIVVAMDSGNTVMESDENDNTASSDPISVDLRLNAVVVRPSPFSAAVNYTVVSPIAVAAFKISVKTGATQIALLDGDPSPGAHSASVSDAVMAAALASAGIVSNPDTPLQITATIDPTGAVTESDESSNTDSASATFASDLAATSITFPLGTSLDQSFSADLKYLVGFNAPSQDFKIAIYVSSNTSPAIGSGDKLLKIATVDAAGKSIGLHTATIPGVVVPSDIGFAANFVLKSRIDATGDSGDVAGSGNVGAVNELNENNNVAVGPNVIDIGLDSDGDGLTDAEELAGFVISRYSRDASGQRLTTPVRVFTDPHKADTDGDGISDFDEVVTFARAAGANGAVDFGPGEKEPLGPQAIRANRRVLGPGVDLSSLPANDVRRLNNMRPKPIWGVRSDPTRADTDGDGLNDPDDPAPQIKPSLFGFDASLDLNAAQQMLLLNFDQDNGQGGDGFLEAPDTNGDLVPDFTQYTELSIEQSFGIDFSNNGDLLDGFDIGGLNQGPADTNNPPLFGTYRVVWQGDGFLDALDSTGRKMPIDNCAQVRNPGQGDFDSDGLGDACDADLDNDGIPNVLDPIAQNAAHGFQLSPLCGMGATFGFAGTFMGLLAMRRRR